CEVSVSSVSVEEHGPIRTTVALVGAVKRGSNEFLELRARWDLYRGQANERLRLTLRNPRSATHPGGFWDLGDPNSIFVKDASLTIAAGSDPLRLSDVAGSVEAGAPVERFEVPLEIYQDSSGGQQWDSPN